MGEHKRNRGGEQPRGDIIVPGRVQQSPQVEMKMYLCPGKILKVDFQQPVIALHLNADEAIAFGRLLLDNAALLIG